jgi:iron complex outermembrane recepter protein
MTTSSNMRFACNHRLKRVLYAGAGLLALTGPGFAHAQDAAQSSPPSQPADELTEIVVTSQRRNENLQVVPVAVTVVNGAALQNSDIRDASDLQYVAPSLQYNPSNGGGFQIRGVGTQSYDFSAEQAVSTVVDDVVMDAPRDLGLTGLNDVEQVEVLRGPQGTLFGKNSTSGVVSFTTKAPELGQTSGAVNGSYGERNDFNVNGMVNMPLGADAALRVTGFAQGQGGFGENVFNNTSASFQERGVRAKLLFTPDDKLRVVLNADYAEHVDNYPEGTGAAGLVTATPIYGAASAAAGITIGPNNFQVDEPNPQSVRNSSYGTSLTASYELGRDTLTSVTAFRRTFLDQTGGTNLIASPVFLPEEGNTEGARKISQEFRVASPTGDFIEYVAGVFYNDLAVHATASQWGTLGEPLPPGVYLNPTGVAGGAGNSSVFDTSNIGKSAFGQVKLNMTDRLAVAIGGRFTHDRNSQALSFESVPTNIFLIPLYPAPAQTSGVAEESNFSYSIHPEYKFTSNVFGYLTYATGYKGPGVAFVSNLYSPYKAETVVDYEAGVKSELFDRRLRLNADVFYEKYKDFQAQTLELQPGGLLQYVIGNAGGLRSQGVEADTEFTILPGLNASVSATYADAIFTNYIDGPNNYTGQALPYAPKWSETTALTYQHEVTGGYDVVANANYNYRSAIYAAVGDPATIIKGYGLFGGEIGIRPTGGNWQVGIYGRNLFDTHFASVKSNLAVEGIGTIASYSQMSFRTVGGYVRYHF